jgi:hypothetical protein
MTGEENSMAAEQCPARFSHAKPVSDRHHEAFMLKDAATRGVAAIIWWS